MLDWVLNTPLFAIFHMKQFRSLNLLLAELILDTYILHAAPVFEFFLWHFYTSKTFYLHSA